MLTTLKEKAPALGPKTVAEPEKELRFTRSRQGTTLLAIIAILLAAGVSVLVAALLPDTAISSPVTSLPFFLIAAALFPVAYRCIRHAYLILSPLGIEIFPFFNAKKNLQILYWSEIDHAVVTDSHLTVHFNAARSSGVVVSLAPIPRKRRPLLSRAIEGTMENLQSQK